MFAMDFSFIKIEVSDTRRPLQAKGQNIPRPHLAQAAWVCALPFRLQKLGFELELRSQMNKK